MTSDDTCHRRLPNFILIWQVVQMIEVTKILSDEVNELRDTLREEVASAAR